MKWGWIVLLVAALAYCSSRDDEPDLETVAITEAVPVRGSPPVLEDDPETTNDESNDQPVGYFGTKTLCVYSYDSSNTYTLDVELDGLEVSQMYFPKGGYLYFSSCELDESFEGMCYDNDGDGWQFQGEC